MKNMKIITVVIVLLILSSCVHVQNDSSSSAISDKTESSQMELPLSGEQSTTVSETDFSETLYEFYEIDEDINRDQTIHINCHSLLDNDTPIADLLKKQKPLSKDETIGLINTYYSTGYVDSGIGIVNTNLTAIKTKTGQDITFYRTGADFYNSVYNENGVRCYTVFESEMGGYVYIYFDWYPDMTENNTKIRIVSYAPRVLYYDDIPQLDRWKNNPKDLSAVIPEDEYLVALSQEDISKGIFGYAIHTLKDGFLFAGSATGCNNFIDGYVLQNSFIWERGDEARRENEANNIDFTIHPQDYPPAS